MLWGLFYCRTERLGVCLEMGGDWFSPPCSSEDESSREDDNPEIQSETPEFYRFGPRMKHEYCSVKNRDWLMWEKSDEIGHKKISNPIELDANLRRRTTFEVIEQSYADLCTRSKSLSEAKRKIFSYVPGSWLDKAGNMKFSDYLVPETTTLLLVGPKGSGKSSLVNRISRVFEDDKFASERAQVSYNSASGDGTYFLQEYMIPKNSTSFCLYDTRSLSSDPYDNNEMICYWMTQGVRHGELVIRSSDNSNLRSWLKCKGHASGPASSPTRKVNFVIFVVNGFSVLRSMKCEKEEKQYIKMVAEAFRCPYLSFRDDKPVIVVTHGDLLTSQDQANVRVFLGEQLGVPPVKQIFDIPETNDETTEMAILDMIRYSLEHADRNLPSKDFMNRCTQKVGISFIALLFLLMALLVGVAAFHMNSSYHVPWPKFQGIWNLSRPYSHHVTSSELPVKFHADNSKRYVDQTNGHQGPLKSAWAGRHQTCKHQDHLTTLTKSEHQHARQLNEHQKPPSKPGKSKLTYKHCQHPSRPGKSKHAHKHRRPPFKSKNNQHKHEHHEKQKADSEDTVNWDVMQRLWLADE